jgi:EAL domain-containing protein (putative c-di-GMP-specific phosphodiesterase class I)
MGTRLVALDIATPAEMAALRRAGVSYGQGELVGPAGPILA